MEKNGKRLRKKFILINEFLPRLSGVVLDVGCGSDPFKNLSILEKQEITKAFAIDSNRTAIECLKKWRPHRKISYLMIGAEELTETKLKFDYIFCWFSLSHFDNIEKGIENIGKSLKKGGMVLFGEGVHLKGKNKKTSLIKRKIIQQQLLEIRKSLYRHTKMRLPEISEREALEIVRGYSEHKTQMKSLPEIKELAKKAGLKLLKEEFNRQEWSAAGEEWSAIFEKTK